MKKKLKINKETLRNLSGGSVKAVVGGTDEGDTGDLLAPSHNDTCGTCSCDWCVSDSVEVFTACRCND